MADFTAKARIPTRPLSYENKDMAVNKELMIDYSNGKIYVKDMNGEIHDISVLIQNAIKEDIREDSSIVFESVKVTIPDKETGESTEVTIDKAVISTLERLDLIDIDLTQIHKDIDGLTSGMEEVTKDIASLKEKNDSQDTEINSLKTNAESMGSNISTANNKLNILSSIIGEDNTVKVPSANVVTGGDRQFVTQQQINNINAVPNKTGEATYTLTIAPGNWTGSAAPYSATITASWATTNMRPPVMDLVASSYYATAQKEVEGYQIYKAVTNNGSITFYNMAKPTVNLTIQFKVTV